MPDHESESNQINRQIWDAAIEIYRLRLSLRRKVGDLAESAADALAEDFKIRSPGEQLRAPASKGAEIVDFKP